MIQVVTLNYESFPLAVSVSLAKCAMPISNVYQEHALAHVRHVSEAARLFDMKEKKGGFCWCMYILCTSAGL